MNSYLPLFFLWIILLVSYLTMLCWTQDHKDFLFSSRSFKVWGLTFDLWSILSFYIICKVQSSFPFLQMDVWLFQHFLFKRLSLLHWAAFAGTLITDWQTHSWGVSGIRILSGNEASVLCGITLPSCQPHISPDVCSSPPGLFFSRPFGWFSLFASPSWPPACWGPVQSSYRQKNGL